MGSALVSRSNDQYTARQTRETITSQVNDAVRSLEEAKLTLEAGKLSYDLAQKSLAADQRKYELGAETNFLCWTRRASWHKPTWICCRHRLITRWLVLRWITRLAAC